MGSRFLTENTPKLFESMCGETFEADGRPLRRELNLLVQKLRRNVGAVRPSERVKLGMYGELLEDLLIFEGLEDLTIQLVAKIHIAFSSIGETKVDHIVPYVACFRNSRYHLSLLQRCDSPGWAAAVNEMPILNKFVPVKIKPLQHETQRPLGEIPLYDSGFDVDRDLIVSIDRVEVHWQMIPWEYADYDSEKS
jgi:hypothetical protein